jgi:esterase/lipase
VAHGRHDGTAPVDDAAALCREVGSREVQLLVLDESAHVVPVDRDGPRLAGAVAEFLGRYA